MILVDTGPLYALTDRRDMHHAEATEFYRSVAGVEPLLLPSPVLTEGWMFVKRRLGAVYANRMWESAVSGAFRLADVDELLLEQALDIERQYADSEFGLIDSVCFALCERMKIKRVFTFDRKHFSTYVPTFARHLELVP